MYVLTSDPLALMTLAGVALVAGLWGIGYVLSRKIHALEQAVLSSLISSDKEAHLIAKEAGNSRSRHDVYDILIGLVEDKLVEMRMIEGPSLPVITYRITEEGRRYYAELC